LRNDYKLSHSFRLRAF